MTSTTTTFSLVSLTLWFAACTAQREGSGPSAAPAARPVPECTPGWVYLKDPAFVESRRGVDIFEKNVVLVGCMQELTTLTAKDRTALETVFAPSIDQKEHEVREILRRPDLRAQVAARANQAVGRAVINDWHVDFWSMCF